MQIQVFNKSFQLTTIGGVNRGGCFLTRLISSRLSDKTCGHRE